MAPSIVQAAFSLLFAGSALANSDFGYAPVLENRYATVLDKRVVPTTLPGTWVYQGCYSEGANRALGGQMYANATGMTTESCIAFCDNLGAYYAGTEYSSECCKWIRLSDTVNCMSANWYFQTVETKLIPLRCSRHQPIAQ